MKDKAFCGIDLGTSNSVIAVLQGRRVEVLSNAEGERLTPSVVKFLQDEQVLVGGPAKRSSLHHSERVVEEVKRQMGTEWTYETPEGEEYRPEEISGYIVNKIKVDAEEKLGSELTRAVISVPAHFKEMAREATKTAGELGGFEEVTLITEPVAGILAELLEDRDISGRVMVFDLGGGTFDCSILECEPPNFETLAIAGDGKLGGSDFTRFLVERLKKETGPFPNIELKQDAYKRAEDAKRDLSFQNKGYISIPVDSQGNPGDNGMVSIQPTREEFEGMIEQQVDNTIQRAEEALDEANLTWEDLDEIIMVGGSTRIPLIQSKLAQASGMEPRMSSEPDEAVARGALVKAAIKEDIPILTKTDEALPPPQLTDILAHSIGVKTKNLESGKVHNKVLIQKGTKLPDQVEEIFTTQYDNQNVVEITLLQGESEKIEDCEIIGKEGGYRLEGVPRKPKGLPRIKLVLKITKGGIIQGQAMELDTGKPVTIQYERPQLIKEEDKDKAKKRIDESEIN